MPLSAAGLALSFAVAAACLLRHGIGAPRVGALLLLSLLLGLPATGLLMRSVHAVFERCRAAEPSDGKAALAFPGSRQLHQYLRATPGGPASARAVRFVFMRPCMLQ